MDVNVDIGNNLTSLLERLAQQIGTTADKVFPWYVQQSYLEGVIFIWGVGIVLVVGMISLVYGIVKGQWKRGEPGNLAATLTILGGGCLFVATITAMLGVPDAITKVYNPQYHAMKMLTRDIGRLTARQ